MPEPASFVVLQPYAYLGDLKQTVASPALPDGAWYEAAAEGDGMSFLVPDGALAGAACISADFLVETDDLVVFVLKLYETPDDSGAAFSYEFKALNHCQARLRMPIAALDQNRWMWPREGALLKPLAGGARLEAQRIRFATLTILRKSARPARWCMTPLAAMAQMPELLSNPLLPRGPLIDALGQSTQRDWPGKLRSTAEVTTHLRALRANAGDHAWPNSYSRWGGWREKRFEASGFFRTQFDEASESPRWWLVDPDGHAFWSTGPDCVQPGNSTFIAGLAAAFEQLPPREGDFAPAWNERHGRPAFNALATNLIRAFGPDDWYDAWREITIGLLREVGFNTVANWSHLPFARSSGLPYVLPMAATAGKTPDVFRDFPDVFAASFDADAASFAAQLADYADDPALIGYFMMNEPKWGFAAQTPAEGMLLNTPQCASRAALARFLRERYADAAALSAAWGAESTFEAIAGGPWRQPLGERAKADLAAFSAVMVDRYFATLAGACRAVDANHLNLGVRYYTVPPDWCITGMRCFDVFSINSYTDHAPSEKMEAIASRMGMPVMIGEWHFGALDAGLPASGIGHVPDQAARGRAYRVYLEEAAACPACVGAHWFQWNDQSALGRFDGENYNIGFVDVCNQVYPPLAAEARAAHERLYDIADRRAAPCVMNVDYLPRLF